MSLHWIFNQSREDQHWNEKNIFITVWHGNMRLKWKVWGSWCGPVLTWQNSQSWPQSADGLSTKKLSDSWGWRSDGFHKKKKWPVKNDKPFDLHNLRQNRKRPFLYKNVTYSVCTPIGVCHSPFIGYVQGLFLDVVFFFNMIWLFLWHINVFNVRH